MFFYLQLYFYAVIHEVAGIYYVKNVIASAQNNAIYSIQPDVIFGMDGYEQKEHRHTLHYKRSDCYVFEFFKSVENPADANDIEQNFYADNQKELSVWKKRRNEEYCEKKQKVCEEHGISFVNFERAVLSSFIRATSLRAYVSIPSSAKRLKYETIEFTKFT